MKKGQMTIIGVLENSKHRTTFRLLKEMFIISDYEVTYENKYESMAILTKERENILILDMDLNLINAIEDLGIDFDVLIHTFLNPEDYHNQRIQKIFGASKYIIVNIDQEKWTDLLEDNSKPIVITYGFNNKATISPTSYIIHDLTEVNLCFQREIMGVYGSIVEPFEMQIKIDSKETLDIYCVVGALISCVLFETDKFSEEIYIKFTENGIKNIVIEK